MPHLRKRYLTESLSNSIAFSPIVGVLGHRQVGKTTLAERVGNQYISLDQKKDRDLAQNTPDQLLKKYRSNPLVIDECQKAPALFDELKDWVRTHKKPGQFLLTGSVRFTSKKAIQESLTGRIVYHELLPFTVSEIEHRPLPRFVLSLMKAKDLTSWLTAHAKGRPHSSALLKSVHDYQAYGGLPGIFFIRNEKLRIQKIQDQLQTILDRDLREIVSTRLSFTQIIEFAEALARQEGTPISYTRLQQETGVSSVNAKKLIAALEATFVIRLLRIEGGRKGWIFYFEDQAESRYLSAGKLDPSIYYSGFLYRNIRAEFYYSGEHHFRFFHYLTKHDTTLPFAVEWDGKYLGCLPLKASKPSHAEIMAAQSFLKRFNDAKVMMIHPDAEMTALSERVAIFSDAYLF